MNFNQPVNKRPVVIGELFGRLTVVKEVPAPAGKHYGTFVLCKCTCGGTVVRRLATLRSHAKSATSIASCGCRGSVLPRWRSRPYRIWAGMHNRCENSVCKDYPRYGGLGITVCEAWRTFGGFWADMSRGYSDALTLNRVDPNGGYCPENCRWATVRERAQNRRRSIRVNGKSLKEWAVLTGICYATLISRYSNGDRGDRLFRPVTARRKNDTRGKS